MEDSKGIMYSSLQSCKLGWSFAYLRYLYHQILAKKKENQDEMQPDLSSWNEDMSAGARVIVCKEEIVDSQNFPFSKVSITEPLVLLFET